MYKISQQIYVFAIHDSVGPGELRPPWSPSENP